MGALILRSVPISKNIFLQIESLPCHLESSWGIKCDMHLKYLQWSQSKEFPFCRKSTHTLSLRTYKKKTLRVDHDSVNAAIQTFSYPTYRTIVCEFAKKYSKIIRHEIRLCLNHILIYVAFFSKELSPNKTLTDISCDICDTETMSNSWVPILAADLFAADGHLEAV